LDVGRRIKSRGSNMVAYQFYLWDTFKGYELVGVLPERRHNPERITEESIINWGKTNFFKDVKPEEIFFIKVDVEEGERGNFKITYQ
jgi:hypothetical protein